MAFLLPLIEGLGAVAEGLGIVGEAGIAAGEAGITAGEAGTVAGEVIAEEQAAALAEAEATAVDGTAEEGVTQEIPRPPDARLLTPQQLYKNVLDFLGPRGATSVAGRAGTRITYQLNEGGGFEKALEVGCYLEISF